MSEIIEKIKKSESRPKVIRNLFDKIEIEKFLSLYNDLPVTVHNKKQNVIKKRWLQGYNTELESLFCQRLKKEIDRSLLLLKKHGDLKEKNKEFRNESK